MSAAVKYKVLAEEAFAVLDAQGRPVKRVFVTVEREDMLIRHFSVDAKDWTPANRDRIIREKLQHMTRKVIKPGPSSLRS